ncbi:MAG: ATP synthase subunit I [Spirulina sp. SIO3F2]|nr:ATP synthase subunit I [Spirulina sp. SIO3F2]
MQDYYQLKQQILIITLGITVVGFLAAWTAFSLIIALNYLLGAGVGLVYLRLLAREVERLDSQNQRIGLSRLALFAGLIIVASQLQQLYIVPIFLGFVTYKLAVVFYTVQMTFN